MRKQAAGCTERRTELQIFRLFLHLARSVQLEERTGSGFRTWLLCAAAVAVRLHYCKNGSCSSPTAHLSGYALRTGPLSIALSFRREGVRVVCGFSVVSHRSPLYSTLKLPTVPSEQTSRRALWPCFRFRGHHFPSDCTGQRDTDSAGFTGGALDNMRNCSCVNVCGPDGCPSIGEVSVVTWLSRFKKEPVSSFSLESESLKLLAEPNSQDHDF